MRIRLNTLIKRLRNRESIQQTRNRFDMLPEEEVIRLKALPRYDKFAASFGDKIIVGSDAASFLFSYDEIWKKQVYFFKSYTETPLIVDAGANVGLSVLYFKTLYPKSKIFAFEADPTTFSILQKNVYTFFPDDKSVVLVNRALWNEETEVAFAAEGADAGRIDPLGLEMIKVKTALLSDYLQNEVDYLKVDIEGAEHEVLAECAKKLGLVKNLFIESHSYISKPQDLHKILALLQSHGFRYYMETPLRPSNNPHQYVHNYLNMDMQVSIYGVRPNS